MIFFEIKSQHRLARIIRHHSTGPPGWPGPDTGDQARIAASMASRPR
jgi:hypothetical protein